jgi:hypothetical protein
MALHNVILVLLECSLFLDPLARNVLLVFIKMLLEVLHVEDVPPDTTHSKAQQNALSVLKITFGHHVVTTLEFALSAQETWFQ